MTTANDPNEPVYIRLSTACRRYDTSRTTFYRAFEAGTLANFKRDGSVYLRVADVEAWITGRSNAAA